jgi:hypothetical protein
LADAHEVLLDAWAAADRHRDRCFIRDGILDPDLWATSCVRVCFVFREAYGDPGDKHGWDLRKKVRDEWLGPKYKMWWTVGRWAYAIFRVFAKQPAPFPIDRREIRDAFLSVAVVNIKKSGGRSASNLDEIGQYAHDDRELLLQQIALIRPEIIVTGNLGARVRQELWPQARPLGNANWQVDRFTLLNIWHPANRFSNQRNYNDMLNLLQVAL